MNSSFNDGRNSHSKSDFKIFHDEAGIGIGIYDEQGNIISFNKVAAHHMGGKPDDFTGKNILNLFQGNEGQKYLERIQKALNSDNTNHYEDTIELNGKEVCFYSIYNKINEQGNKYVQIISQDITHLINREKTFKENELKYRFIFENTGEGILLVKNNIIVECNQHFCEMVQYDKSEVIGKEPMFFSPKTQPDGSDSFEKGLLHILEALKKGNHSFNWYHLKRNNQTLEVKVSLKGIKQDGEEYVIAIMHDVTELLNYQKQLKESNEEYAAVNEELTEANKRLEIINKHIELSETKFRAAFKTSPDSININRLKDGLYIEINEGFTKLTGFTEEDVKGKTSADIDIWVHKEDRAKLVKVLLENGSYSNLEAQFRRKDGSITTALMSANIIELGTEKFILSVTRDISERISYQKRIEQQEKYLRTIIQSNNDGFWVVDKAGKIIDVNTAYCKMTGYSREEMLKMTVHDQDKLDTEKDVKERMLRIRKNGFEVFRTKHRRKNKPDVDVEISATYLEVEGGQYICFSRDITEKVEREKELMVKETAIQSSLSGIGLVDLDGKIFYVNKAYLKFWGHQSEDEIIGKHFSEFGNFNGKDQDIFNRIMQGETYSGELLAYRKDGKQIYSDIAVTPIKSEQGEVIYAMASFVDITRRKEAEKEIANLATMVDIAPNAILIHDFEGNVLFTNEKNLELHGYSREEFLKLNIVKDVDLPVPAKLFNERAKQINEKGEASFEVEHYRKDGSIFPLMLYVKLVDWNGKPAMLSIGTDITEIRKAQKDIQLNKEILNETQRLSKVGGWEFDVQNQTMKWTDEVYRIHDFEIEDNENLSPDLVKKSLACYSGDGADAVEKAFKNCVEKGISYDLVVQFRSYKGKKLWVRTAGNPIFENGKVVKVRGNIIDITKQKQAEEQLIKEKEWSDKIVNQAPNVIVGLGEESEIKIFNKFAEELTGFKENEVLGKSWIETFIPEEIREQTRKVWEQAVSGLSIKHSGQNPILTKSGQQRLIKWRNSVLTDEGKFKMIVSIGEDITEFNKTIDALVKSEERLNSIFRVAPIGIGLVKERVISEVNETLCSMLGYTAQELLGKSARKLYPSKKEFEFVGKEKYEQIAKYGSGTVETIWKRKDGSLMNVLLSSTPIVQNDLMQGVTFTALDITQRKQAELLNNAHIQIAEYATNHSVKDVLQKTLDEAEKLTESKIGFYHFVDEKRKAINIQSWSTKTIAKYCKVGQEFEKNYPLSKAGVWVEAVYKRKPVIHNNYDMLPERKGMPPGHAEITKELVVPVIRNKKVVAILGVGNKKDNYDEQDIFTLSKLADLVWDIVEKRKVQEELHNSLLHNKAILDANPDLMFVFSEKGEVLDYKAENMDDLYKKPNEFLGKNIQDLLPPDLGALTMQKIAEAKETKNLVQYNYSLTFKGKENYYESRLVPSGDDRYVAIVRDITKSRMSEMNLIESKQKLKDAQKIAKLGSWEMNHVTNQLEWSEETYEIFELNSSTVKLTYKKFISLVHHDDRQFVQRAYNDSLLDRLPYEINHRIITQKGNLKYVKQKCRTTFDQDGKPIKSIGIIYDISDLKNTENKLIKAKEKAEESDRLKSAFLANMSHEIRTPMNAILGFSNLLKDKEFEKEKQTRFLNIINQRTKDLLRIIDDVIDISKIEANQLKIEKENFSLNDLLIGIYNNAEAELQSLNKDRVKIILNPDLLKETLIIKSDQNRIRQVFSNLINNALKFTDEGSIEMGYKINNGHIEFFVKDTGVGVAKEFHEIIFERFRQADDSSTRKYGGTGLGLPICKNIMELLGGKIWIKSKQGEGSTFYFTIPYKEIKLKESTQSRSTSVRKYYWPDKRVLIVEDDKVSLYYLIEMLEDTGVIISEATCGKDALKLVGKQNFDLILLDINLPDLSGNEIAQKIKKMYPEIKVVAQSAYSMLNEVKRSMTFGFDEYITKPIDPKLLMSTINRFLKE